MNIWRKYMEITLQGISRRHFTRPCGIIRSYFLAPLRLKTVAVRASRCHIGSTKTLTTKNPHTNRRAAVRCLYITPRPLHRPPAMILLRITMYTDKVWRHTLQNCRQILTLICEVILFPNTLVLNYLGTDIYMYVYMSL